MRVLFAISDSFPYGRAYAARARAFCKLLQSIECKVDVLCDYNNGDNTEEYGRIFYAAEKEFKGVKKLIKLPFVYAKKLNLLLDSNEYDCIISRSMFDRFGKILKIAKKRRIPIILESCEWYDVRGFARGKVDIRYWQFKRCFNKLYNRVDGVIAISRLLEEHYKKYVSHVVRIPGIHDIEKLPYRIKPNATKKISFLFAGNIYGGKEQFEDFLLALSRINSDAYVVNVYGPSREELITGLDKEGIATYEMVKRNIIFHGTVSQQKIAEACIENDYGFFFRPQRRSSNAGFPTKLGEYLSAGTPVITNNTGDISLIIENGKNGFLIDEVSKESLSNVISKLLNLSDRDKELMRAEARKTATIKLDFHSYIGVLSTFIKDVIGEKKQ